MTKILKAFYYKGDLYVRTIPSKRLFNSTMIHEVVNRGDVFAMKVSTQEIHIVPGKAEVTHMDLPITTPLVCTNQSELEFD